MNYEDFELKFDDYVKNADNLELAQDVKDDIKNLFDNYNKMIDDNKFLESKVDELKELNLKLYSKQKINVEPIEHQEHQEQQKSKKQIFLDSLKNNYVK